MLKSHLSPCSLIELMEAERYGVEYQPLIDMQSGEISGYESLARFFDADKTPIRPDLVYSALHDSPVSLFQVEYQQKKLQLANAPAAQKIFVNLDQDSYFASGKQGADNPFLKLFNRYSKETVAVELIENSEVNDAVMSLAMIDALSKNGIDTAIDDVCNPQSMLSTSVIQLVDFIKLDKHVVRNKQDSSFMCLVKALVNYAHDAGKKVVLEGVEDEVDLVFARELNADFVQGFLYRDRFIQVV